MAMAIASSRTDGRDAPHPQSSSASPQHHQHLSEVHHNTCGPLPKVTRLHTWGEHGNTGKKSPPEISTLKGHLQKVQDVARKAREAKASPLM